MQTLTTQTTIATDGSLHIDIPHSSLPPGEADVVLVVQPRANGTAQSEQVLREEQVVYKNDVSVNDSASSEAWRPGTPLSEADQEKMRQLGELFKHLKGANWDEIHEGRADRDFGA